MACGQDRSSRHRNFANSNDADPSQPGPTMTDEQHAQEIRDRFGLSSLHLFQSDIPGMAWRVYASRKHPKGFEESVVSGGGRTIREAIDSMEERLIAGPINKPYVPFLDPEPKQADTDLPTAEDVRGILKQPI